MATLEEILGPSKSFGVMPPDEEETIVFMLLGWFNNKRKRGEGSAFFGACIVGKTMHLCETVVNREDVARIGPALLAPYTYLRMPEEGRERNRIIQNMINAAVAFGYIKEIGRSLALTPIGYAVFETAMKRERFYN